MMTVSPPTSPSFFELAACFARKIWIRKDKDLLDLTDEEAELTRLAETAPHLLVDIGFIEMPVTCTPGCRVLCRGPLRLELWADGTVSLLRH